MASQTEILHNFTGDICALQIPFCTRAGDNLHSAQNKPNNRNCDIFMEDHNFYFYADTRLYKFQLQKRQFDIKNIKNLVINFNTINLMYEVNLPCLPQSGEEAKTISQKSGDLRQKICGKTSAVPIDLWKLKRITNICQLQYDNNGELLNFVADYGYGFMSKYKGKIPDDNNVPGFTNAPHLASPLQRAIDRQFEEMKNFSRTQYKMNFLELQVDEGHDNPLNFVMCYDDVTLSREEYCLLHNLSHAHHIVPISKMEKSEVDCGLVSILLAICYDIRVTSNEQTCESGWTRTILSATLSGYEPCANLKDVIITFLRRTLIYPLYRNYELGRMCVMDAINGLLQKETWLIQQLLQTHKLFEGSETPRKALNRYYIEDYIRYVAVNSGTYIRVLARNVKNVLLDITKKHLGLGLLDIETEFLKALITDIHVGDASCSEDDDDDENEDEETEDEYEDDDDTGEDNEDGDFGEDQTESSSASDTEQNSVIEQCKEVVNA